MKTPFLLFFRQLSEEEMLKLKIKLLREECLLKQKLLLKGVYVHVAFSSKCFWHFYKKGTLYIFVN